MAATELVLELLYATSRIHETLFAGVHWMRIHSNIANHLYVVYAVNIFTFASLFRDRRERLEFFSSRNVYENSWIVFWMNALLHGKKNWLN